ncbi:unnamed protein product [Ambrosiozyma monospora]|uniref:Unnamed protein product n=1 Tax=Ambrosiozyma monospora TaxID=43982 RepID=A0ACB5TVF6_AMBMO|nr:unnamed protein product [Ambrosiozyma monospora]
MDNLSLVKVAVAEKYPWTIGVTTQYKEKYDEIQTKFYSRWAGSDAVAGEPITSQDEYVFPMYGPTQIEFEILIVPEVVATKSLLLKLKRLNIFPTQQQMRSISNARRWINQRFKYDRKHGCVIYLRDSEVIIPDYDDVPYIVLATHLHYRCLSDVFTYNIVRKQWYISKKSVEYILERCPLCGSHNK